MSVNGMNNVRVILEIRYRRQSKHDHIFTYPPSFLCLTFHYSYRATRFFIDEFSVLEFREYSDPKGCSFRIYKFVHSIQAKRNAVCEFK